ncbi:MAG TPA: cupredoxin domain-containing protein [Candidatus Baltobacteraceae bacterium]|nr:cupredoxin domain-containing protein [Candidatus Baltobacteraceae bacterium]
MKTLLISLALLFAAATPTPAPTTAPVLTVHIRDFAFAPSAATVHAGDTVEFVNDDPATHDVTSDAVKSGPIAPGKHWTHTFADAGTYAYICSYHPSMKGTITVTK